MNYFASTLIMLSHDDRGVEALITADNKHNYPENWRSWYLTLIRSTCGVTDRWTDGRDRKHHKLHRPLTREIMIDLYMQKNWWVLLLRGVLSRKLYTLIRMAPRHPYPAGIIDLAEAQMKLNLNEWVCTDMNVCWSYPESIQNINNQQRDYIE